MKDQNKISFAAAVLMSINVMVGAGILIAVGPMTATAGSMSFLSWPLIGLLLLPIILGLAKASRLFPGEGGFYHYCTSGINPLAGVSAHWLYLLGYMGSAASLSTVLRNGLVDAFPDSFIGSYPFVFNVLLVAFYAGLNLISLSKISRIQSTGTLLKIAPIVTVIAMMLFYYNPSIGFSLNGLSNVSLTISTVLFAFLGFETCCSIGGLLRDGPQKVGTVVVTAFFVTMALYSLFHIGLIFIMGPDNLAQYGAIAFPQYLGLSPAVGATIQAGITIAILFSWANSILSMSLANITNIFTLAKNKLVLADKTLTKVNNSQRPFYVVLLHGAILLLYITFVRDIDILLALTNIGVGASLTLTMVAVLRTLLIQKKYVQATVPFLALGSCGVWIYYSCLSIPSVWYVVPLALGLMAGIAMFRIQKSRESEEVLAPAA